MVTLNRASRKAAQPSQKKAASHDRTGQSGSAHVCTRIAGAMPNEMRSASESSCRPNGEVAPTSRATPPSAMSMTIETAMSTAATREVPAEREQHRREPLIMLTMVKRLGAMTRSRSRLGQLAQRDDLGAGRRDEPPAVEASAAARRVRRSRRHRVEARPARDDGLAGHDAVTRARRGGRPPAGRRRPSASRTSSGRSADRCASSSPGRDPGDDPAGHAGRRSGGSATARVSSPTSRSTMRSVRSLRCALSCLYAASHLPGR